MKKEFMKNTFYSSAGFGVLIVCNLLFNFFAARWLGTENYGIYMSFFYLLIAFTQPINSFQLAVAKYVAEKKLDTGTGIRGVTSTLLVLSLILVGFFTVAAPLMKSIYHLPGWHISLVGGLALVMWLGLAGYRGVHQGEMNFLMYGVNIGAEGILRAGFGVMFILLGWGITGAVGASVASGILGVLMLVFAYRKGLIKEGLRFKMDGGILKEFMKAFLVLLPFGLIMNLDLTLVQYVVGGDVSGYLSACGLFGKNLIVLSMVVANVVYSYAVRKEGKTFWAGIAITVLLFVAAILFILPTGEWLIKLLFGSDYLPVVGILPLYILATLPLGVLQHIANYAVAKELKLIKILFWVLLAGLALIYYVSLRNMDIRSFLKVMLISVSAADIVLLFLTNIMVGKRK